MMVEGNKRPIWIRSHREMLNTLTNMMVIRRIVVFIPDEPLSLLFMLNEAAELLNITRKPLEMLILTRSPSTWLWQTLLSLVDNYQLLSSVKVAPSDLQLPSLMTLFKGGLNNYPVLQKMSAIESKIYGKVHSGLSKIEFDATISLLKGYSITYESVIYDVNQKTLYNRRASGVSKILESHPHYTRRFPGSRSKRQKKHAALCD